MFSNIFNQAVFRLFTMLLSAVFGVSSFPAGINKPLPETPDDFTPVIRFAVVSDIHLDGNPEQENAKRLARLFEDAYAYSESSSYKKLDAVCVAGDFATSGADEEYKVFNDVVNANIKDGTQIIAVMGNHEFIKYRDDDYTVAFDKYKEYVNEDLDRHLVINGYHFIACSYSTAGGSFETKKDWLKGELDTAVADTGDKPVFVFQHPHPFATVYGSVNWSNFDMRTIYGNYPQVIDFSGHSHYSPSDPRTIWQGSFTAVGTGSLGALMGNLNYIDGDKDAPGESGSFWIVEADAQGNVRLRLYDIVSRMFFEKNDYYLTDVAKRSQHRYTWSNLRSLDTAPVFPEGAAAKAVKADDGKVILTFPDAEGYWGAEDYKIVVSQGAFNKVWSKTVISDYVRADSTEMNVDLGEIPDGTYTVKITPYSPYAKAGNTLTSTITVG